MRHRSNEDHSNAGAMEVIQDMQATLDEHKETLGDGAYVSLSDGLKELHSITKLEAVAEAANQAVWRRRDAGGPDAPAGGCWRREGVALPGSRQHCDAKCQKAHWKQHKLHHVWCSVPTAVNQLQTAWPLVREEAEKVEKERVN